MLLLHGNNNFFLKFYHAQILRFNMLRRKLDFLKGIALFRFNGNFRASPIATLHNLHEILYKTDFLPVNTCEIINASKISMETITGRNLNFMSVTN